MWTALLSPPQSPLDAQVKNHFGHFPKMDPYTKARRSRAACSQKNSKAEMIYARIIYFILILNIFFCLFCSQKHHKWKKDKKNTKKVTKPEPIPMRLDLWFVVVCSILIFFL